MKKFAAVAILALSASAFAGMHEVYVFDNLGLQVPDNNAAGVTNTQNLQTQITNITDVDVDLFVDQRVGGTATNGWNGDLRVTLSHSSGFAVLLNRVGVRGGTNPAPPGGGSSSFGYDDEGVDILLDDEAGADVHYYRWSLFGSHDTALPGDSPLGQGSEANWQPDGRLVDIGLGSATTAEQQAMVAEPRAALLSVFDGLDANGAWVLNVQDQAGGDTHDLLRWSLHISGTPEPASLVLLALGALIRRR